ncbi:ATP-binding cassette domain-containing protein [Dethiosulfatarculus sandiegensis]|uniref:ABC transporter n=1 Tax=Dethiosulfatarculus sandiegensis TaxID=1429043 RepID=A0A0D2K294_9BACT|nr:ATP-binding cassette domain-containing protein [Dethiosulfatarculus sandiegensis]KIX15790.1 ABC transporter [Dethiosulfatarculus sandiegensis]
MSLICRSLSFAYGSRPVFQDVSFEVQKGEFCAVLGCNGSGKSTLLNCLAGLLTPQKGEIFIGKIRPGQDSLSQVAKVIGLVPQEHNDIFPFKVLDVVVMGIAPYLGLGEKPGKQHYAQARQALADLGCPELAQRNFNQISGGERRLTLLARALVQSSSLLLLDEPTNHLDFHNTYRVLGRIRGLCLGRKLSVVASLHDPNLAARFADQVVMIKDGRVLAWGEPEKVMTPEYLKDLYDVEITAVAPCEGHAYFVPRLPEILKGGLKEEDSVQGKLKYSQKGGVVLLTGDRGSGKSTLLLELLEYLREKDLMAAGFVARGLWKDGVRSGFDLQLAASGEIIPLARRVPASKRTGSMPFKFDEKGLKAGDRALTVDACSKAKVIMVDEVGPLEMSDQGWAPRLGPLLSLDGKIQIWVVRDSLLEEVPSKWGFKPRLIVSSQDPRALDLLKQEITAC